MRSEQQWAQLRQGNGLLNQAVTDVENWTRTHGRPSLPDDLLARLLYRMEEAVGFRQYVVPPNVQLFKALVKGGADANGDGLIGGMADVEAAYGRAGGQPLLG